MSTMISITEADGENSNDVLPSMLPVFRGLPKGCRSLIESSPVGVSIVYSCEDLVNVLVDSANVTNCVPPWEL
jgi:hypothetical protein